MTTSLAILAKVVSILEGFWAAVQPSCRAAATKNIRRLRRYCNVLLTRHSRMKSSQPTQCKLKPNFIIGSLLTRAPADFFTSCLQQMDGAVEVSRATAVMSRAV